MKFSKIKEPFQIFNRKVSVGYLSLYCLFLKSKCRRITRQVMEMERWRRDLRHPENTEPPQTSMPEVDSICLQVNGKVVGHLCVSVDEWNSLFKDCSRIKGVSVPGKLVNLVVQKG